RCKMSQVWAWLLGGFGLLFVAAMTLTADPPTAPVSKLQTVKVAAVQCSSELGAVEANRQKLTALVREAAREGAKIVVLPETSVTGYLSQDLRVNWHLPGWPIEREFLGKDPR